MKEKPKPISYENTTQIYASISSATKTKSPSFPLHKGGSQKIKASKASHCTKIFIST